MPKQRRRKPPTGTSMIACEYYKKHKKGNQLVTKFLTPNQKASASGNYSPQKLGESKQGFMQLTCKAILKLCSSALLIVKKQDLERFVNVVASKIIPAFDALLHRIVEVTCLVVAIQIKSPQLLIALLTATAAHKVLKGKRTS